MSAPIESLLPQLDGVKQCGTSRWLARCPAHDDKRPSLSVQETSDGTVLLHCFAGCSPADVLAGVGMTLAELFPARHATHRGRRKPFFTAREILQLLDFESLVVIAVAADVAAGRPVNDEDTERVALSRERISRVREVCRV